MTEHFVIVGAQRCGTTRLYKLLQQHPDICMAMPMRPEPKFFLEENAVEVGYTEYLRRFYQHRNGQKVLGEKSTSYIERPDAIARMRAVLPRAKLVFVLRDPVRRAYSNWRFSRMHGLETLEFEQALDAEPERLHQHASSAGRTTSVCPFAYAARGNYARYLGEWAKVFPREQFIILSSETLFSSHDAVRGIFRRLALEPDVPLHEEGRVNPSEGEDPDPPAAAISRLREHFRENNDRLTREWHVDISAWQ